jgi:hypothetical protein
MLAHRAAAPGMLLLLLLLFLVLWTPEGPQRNINARLEDRLELFQSLRARPAAPRSLSLG